MDLVTFYGQAPGFPAFYDLAQDSYGRVAMSSFFAKGLAFDRGGGPRTLVAGMNSSMAVNL